MHIARWMASKEETQCSVVVVNSFFQPYVYWHEQCEKPRKDEETKAEKTEKYNILLPTGPIMHIHPFHITHARHLPRIGSIGVVVPNAGRDHPVLALPVASAPAAPQSQLLLLDLIGARRTWGCLNWRVERDSPSGAAAQPGDRRTSYSRHTHIACVPWRMEGCCNWWYEARRLLVLDRVLAFSALQWTPLVSISIESLQVIVLVFVLTSILVP